MTIFHIRDQKYLPLQNLLSNKNCQTNQCLLTNKDAENEAVNYDSKKIKHSSFWCSNEG